MAVRPWATPEEVREYSDIKAVQERTDERIAVDISRAEQYVISYTNNDFSGYERIPQNVKTAVILLAEAYGYNTVVSSKEFKSETFDDYSYTAESKEIRAENRTYRCRQRYVLSVYRNSGLMSVSGRCRRRCIWSW